MTIKLSHKRMAWVATRGGRTEDDVFIVNGRPCVYMWGGKSHKDNVVYIPSDRKIEYRLVGKIHKYILMK